MNKTENIIQKKWRLFDQPALISSNNNSIEKLKLATVMIQKQGFDVSYYLSKGRNSHEIKQLKSRQELCNGWRCYAVTHYTNKFTYVLLLLQIQSAFHHQWLASHTSHQNQTD